MEFYEAVQRRRSVRRFRPDPVDDEVLQRILQASLGAPSFANRQPWYLVVVQDPELKQLVREHCEEVEQKTHASATPWFRAFLDDTGLTPEKGFLTEAPLLVLVFGERGAPYWRESCWLAIAQLALAAAAEGLGCLTYTPGRVRGVRKRLGVPRKFALQAIVPIGRPADEDAERPGRKPLDEVLARSEVIEAEHLSLPGAATTTADGAAGYPPGTPLHEVERDHILRTVQDCGGNRTEAARRLGIGRNTLARKLKGS